MIYNIESMFNERWRRCVNLSKDIYVIEQLIKSLWRKKTQSCIHYHVPCCNSFSLRNIIAKEKHVFTISSSSPNYFMQYLVRKLDMPEYFCLYERERYCLENKNWLTTYARVDGIRKYFKMQDFVRSELRANYNELHVNSISAW